MTSSKKCIFILVTLVLFTGCATSEYSIVPIYNNKNSTIMIDSINFGDVAIITDTQMIPKRYSSETNSKMVIYTTDSDFCDKLAFLKVETSQQAYIAGDAVTAELKKNFLKKSNGKCRVTEISNLKFFDCDQPKNSVTEEYFVAEYTAHSRARDGFSEIDTLYVNKKCFNLLLDNFTKKATIKGDEVKKYEF